MENYFHYFTEIEEHFQRRRGTTLLLSTLDWALIETWKEQGLPLAAVLRGIDDAFESFSRRPRRFRKINSLAYCAQAVLEAAEQASEAALGAAAQDSSEAGAAPARRPPASRSSISPGPEEIASYLMRNASLLERSLSSSIGANISTSPAPESPAAGLQSPSPARFSAPLTPTINEIAAALRSLAAQFADLPKDDFVIPSEARKHSDREQSRDNAVAAAPSPSSNSDRQPAAPRDNSAVPEFGSSAVPSPDRPSLNRQSSMSLEDLERSLTVLEEKLFATLIASIAASDLLAFRAEAEASLAPYRRDMRGPQLDQLQRQFLHKRLLEQYRLPRLSLFYMY